VILRADGIHVGLGGRTVLQDVALAVAPGEMVAVLGPNGSGKSTLVRVLAGLLRPEAGAVLLGGHPIERMPRRAVARRLALVPQFAAGDLGFSALETVLMGRAPHGTGLGLPGERDLALARAAMRALDVGHLEARVVDTLSGGERQRVVLARALAQEPEILLLDEPTAHLDLRHQVESLALVRARCRERGMGAVFVVHEPGLAGSYADRVVLLADGGVRATGLPRAVVAPALLAEVYGARVHVAWLADDVALVAPIPPDPQGI
jgi:iron complex transport system ATP-binding protein